MPVLDYDSDDDEDSSKYSLCTHELESNDHEVFENQRVSFVTSIQYNPTDASPVIASTLQYAFPTTIAENAAKYNNQEVKRAEEALGLQVKLAYPSDGDMYSILSNGTITNVSVTAQDFSRGRAVHGPSIAMSKGKAKHQNPNVYGDNLVPSSERKMQQLHTDPFFIAGIPYALSVVVPLDHVLCNVVQGRSADDLYNVMVEHIRACSTNGFNITFIRIDGEGAMVPVKPMLEDKYNGLKVHPSPSKVPLAERKIQTVKGRVRSVIQSLPFSLCRILLILCVVWCVSRLNMVPSKARADKLCSTEALMGRKLDLQRDLRYAFLDYVEVPVLHTDNDVTHERTITALVVQSTGNSNGDFKFFNPYSVRFIQRSTSKPVLPYTENLIERLNILARKDGLYDKLRDRIPHFAIGKPDGDEVVLPPPEINDDMVDAYGEVLAELDEVRDPVPVTESSPMFNSISLPDTELRGGSDNSSSEYGAHNIPYNIRRNSVRSTRSDIKESWKGYSFLSTAYTRKQAEKKFGALAVKAKIKELIQIDDKDVMLPINFYTLTVKQRRKIIRSHIIYQAKYDDDTGAFIKLKARFVGNGSTQSKELYDDFSSPTVTTHAVFINAAIAAKERRIVKTVDIPGAYLNAEMGGEEVLMHIRADEAEILVLLKPEYRKYLREDGSMIVKLTRALYGCVQSAKLWYQDLSSTLKEAGYIPNPKDICVFNKVVDGVQCTITLHVDDLMVTSVNESLIDEVMSVLKSKYERDDEFTTIWV